MNPLDVDTKEVLFDIVDLLAFSDKVDKRSMYVQYKEFIKFVECNVKSLRSDNVHFEECKCVTVTLLKRFVQAYPECSDVIKLMSFCVSFPVSEAVVESWGSTISYLYGNKHTPKEHIDDIVNTGTIDKLTFIKLNGPPPGMMKNRDLLKRALQVHYELITVLIL